jgi:hypothetical protein
MKTTSKDLFPFLVASFVVVCVLGVYFVSKGFTFRQANVPYVTNKLYVPAHKEFCIVTDPYTKETRSISSSYGRSYTLTIMTFDELDNIIQKDDLRVSKKIYDMYEVNMIYKEPFEGTYLKPEDIALILNPVKTGFLECMFDEMKAIY